CRLNSLAECDNPFRCAKLYCLNDVVAFFVFSRYHVISKGFINSGGKDCSFYRSFHNCRSKEQSLIKVFRHSKCCADLLSKSRCSQSECAVFDKVFAPCNISSDWCKSSSWIFNQ